MDRIVHAGDIGKQSVIEQLEAITPVTAVSGNVDGYEEGGFPREAVINLNGFRIAIRHVVCEGGKLIMFSSRRTAIRRTCRLLRNLYATAPHSAVGSRHTGLQAIPMQSTSQPATRSG